MMESFLLGIFPVNNFGGPVTLCFSSHVLISDYWGMLFIW